MYQKSKCLDGFNDLLFQQIFGMPPSKKLLKKFLENVLPLKNIQYLKVLNPVIPYERFGERKKISDLLMQADNNIVNIEVNQFYYRSLNRRNYAYISALYGAYTDAGRKLDNMPNFYQLNLNTNLPKYYNDKNYEYEVYDKENNNSYVDNIKIITYNVDKIKELYYNKGNGEVRKDAPRYAKYLIMLKLNGEELKNYCKGERQCPCIRKDLLN